MPYVVTPVDGDAFLYIVTQVTWFRRRPLRAAVVRWDGMRLEFRFLSSGQAVPGAVKRALNRQLKVERREREASNWMTVEQIKAELANKEIS